MDLIDAFGVATRGHCLRASPNSEMVLLERCSAERSIERFDGNADIGRGRMQLRLSRRRAGSEAIPRGTRGGTRRGRRSSACSVPGVISRRAT